MNEDIRWASRKCQSIYNAEHWYNFYLRDRFCEYGQDYRRVFTTPTHLRETIEILPVLFPRVNRISQSQKLALDLAVVYGDSVLHDADKSAEMLFKKCYSKNNFTFGFFMVPFPVETLISAAEIIKSSKYVKAPKINTTLCGIYADAKRYFLAREYEVFIEKLNFNMQERILVRKSSPISEFNNTMRYMSNLMETGVYTTNYGLQYLEKAATKNILTLLEVGKFNEETATII